MDNRYLNYIINNILSNILLMSYYPNYKDKKFNTKIYNKLIDYRIPKKKKDFESICFPKKYKLQIPQEFVAKFINPKTKYHGLLIFHQIGAGKTCAAINIAENFKGKKKNNYNHSSFFSR